MVKKKIILILGFVGFVAMADNWVVSPILPSLFTIYGAGLLLIIIAVLLIKRSFQTQAQKMDVKNV